MTKQTGFFKDSIRNGLNALEKGYRGSVKIISHFRVGGCSSFFSCNCVDSLFLHLLEQFHIHVLAVMNELKAGGLGDILIAVIDGLKGFPEAITAVFPDTVVQTCIVHLIRNSIQLASRQDRKALAQALKPIYQADNLEGTEQALGEFEKSPLSERFTTVAQS